MGLTSILLIALAVGVVFLMYRVGRGSRETVHAHVAATIQDPEGQGPVDHQGRADDGPDGDGEGGERHGCC